MISSGGCLIGDRGIAAQVGEPEHGADLVGDATRDPAAQDTLAGIATEIDIDQGAGDAGERRRFDRERQRRHQAAKGDKILLGEALGTPRRPGGIDAIHAADGAVAVEAVDEGDIVGMALGLELIE